MKVISKICFPMPYLCAYLVCLQLSKGSDAFLFQNSGKEMIANLNGDVAKLQAQVYSFIVLIYLHEFLNLIGLLNLRACVNVVTCFS